MNRVEDLNMVYMNQLHANEGVDLINFKTQRPFFFMVCLDAVYMSLCD